MKKVLLLIAVLGCSSNIDTGDAEQPRRRPPTVMPELNYMMPGEDQEAAEAATMADVLAIRAEAEAKGEKLPDGFNFAEDGWDDPEPNRGEDTEKSNFPMLFAWAWQGNLHFEDGFQQPGEAGQDHCKTFGKTCDSIWHIQVTDTDVTSLADAIDSNSKRGRCGSYASASQWYPCIIPSLTGSRTLTYFFESASCPNNANQRADMVAALQAVTPWFETLIDVNWNPVTSAAQANVVIRCTNATAPATWRPDGNLSLLWALQGTSSQDWRDTCTTNGFPGSTNPPSTYKQSADMFYGYVKGVIELNWTALFNGLNCTTSMTARRRGLTNIIGHEMGHHFGLAHNQMPDITGLMNANITCQRITSNSMGYADPENFAIFDFDSATGANFNAYDEDISCLLPENQ